ncbi:protein jagged-2-like [Gadus macrocephalus]|uniref:protein jagged-2-like n=1 Tax=Gadus macrocephalus TaxID=80720 RepID=UPI0028CB5D4D|nr:protein jagged-2-like [Gadus macrocephalus]
MERFLEIPPPPNPSLKRTDSEDILQTGSGRFRLGVGRFRLGVEVQTGSGGSDWEWRFRLGVGRFRLEWGSDGRSMKRYTKSFEQDGRVKDRAQIQQAATELIGSLSKRPNSPVMLAVVEVKVETVTTTAPVDYLVPVLVCVFGALWVACIAVCICWTRKRKKDRREAELAARDRTVNNQLQPLAPGHAHKDNRHKDARHETRKLMLERACDGAEDGGGGDEDEEEAAAAGAGRWEEEAAQQEAQQGGGQDEEAGEKRNGPGVKPSNAKGSMAGLMDRGIVGNGGLICTTRPLKGPHRTAYSPKDNRCKNLNAAKLCDDIRDHYV